MADNKSSNSLAKALEPQSAKSEPVKKVDLTALLDNTLPIPFSYNDFLDFLKKEHAVENIDFWEAGRNCKSFINQDREKALSLYPKREKALKDSKDGDSQSLASANSIPDCEDPLAREKQLALKPELDTIVLMYLTTGSKHEVNLPSAVLKKVLLDITVKKDFHPDVLKPALEKTYELVFFFYIR